MWYDIVVVVSIVINLVEIARIYRMRCGVRCPLAHPTSLPRVEERENGGSAINGQEGILLLPKGKLLLSQHCDCLWLECKTLFLPPRTVQIPNLHLLVVKVAGIWRIGRSKFGEKRDLTSYRTQGDKLIPNVSTAMRNSLLRATGRRRGSSSARLTVKMERRVRCDGVDKVRGVMRTKSAVQVQRLSRARATPLQNQPGQQTHSMKTAYSVR